MIEATAELPFMVDVPRREQSRYDRMVAQFAKVKAVVTEKGMIVPAQLAAKMADVSRQRIDELAALGRLDRIELDGHVYFTEESLVEFFSQERKSGRPSKFVKNCESKGAFRASVDFVRGLKKKKV